jgi:hypothetical protein
MIYKDFKVKTEPDLLILIELQVIGFPEVVRNLYELPNRYLSIEEIVNLDIEYNSIDEFSEALCKALVEKSGRLRAIKNYCLSMDRFLMYYCLTAIREEKPWISVANDVSYMIYRLSAEKIAHWNPILRKILLSTYNDEKITLNTEEISLYISDKYGY